MRLEYASPLRYIGESGTQYLCQAQNCAICWGHRNSRGVYAIERVKGCWLLSRLRVDQTNSGGFNSNDESDS